MEKQNQEYIYKLISISFGFFFAFLIFEIFARLLPASKHFVLLDRFECNWVDVNSEIKETCIFMQQPFEKGRYTKGKFPPFPVDAIKKTNDIGQFSSINFNNFINQNLESSFRILSIGDSYVEALQVENNDSFHGILNSYFSADGEKVKSSSIGKSGDPLSQYLLNLQFASQRTNLEDVSIIITVVSNDFDESIFGYKGNLPGAYFEPKKEGGRYKFKYVNYKRSIPSKIINWILDHSSLGSYLFNNLKITSLQKEKPLCILINSCRDTKSFKANIVDSTLTEAPYRYRDGFLATDIFLENIARLRPSEKERRNTLFVVDADRQSIYQNKTQTSKYFLAQRNYFIEKAKIYGFTLIDMYPIFHDHYLKNNIKFEFLNDGHWNSLGHEIVSKEIIKVLNLEKKY